MLHLQLLGGFQIRHNDEEILELLGRRRQTLCAYLILHHHTSLSRQHLAYTFWPDSSDAQARANLRAALSKLRKAWPAVNHYISIDNQSVQWRAGTEFELDTTTFEQYLAAADAAHDVDSEISLLARATGLYSGPLLPDFFEDWILSERERLEQIFLGALERLSELYEERQTYPELCWKPIRRKNDVRAYFPDGGHITFESMGLEDGKFKARSQTFGDAGFSFDAFSRVEFNLYRRNRR